MDTNTILTFVGAFLWFVIGYLSRLPDEEFKPEKIFKTIVAALLVGGLVVIFGTPEQEALTVQGVVERIGAIVVLERAYYAILRRIYGKK